MSGIVGYIQGLSDSAAYAEIICRNKDIDNLLRACGIDPESINRIDCPLIGASNWLNATLLVQMRPPVDSLWREQAHTGNDSIDPWELYLVEPYASSFGSEVGQQAQPAVPSQPEIKIINNAGLPLPAERDNSDGEELASGVVDDGGSNLQAFGASPIIPTGSVERVTEVGVARLDKSRKATQQTSRLQHLSAPARWMSYRGLILNSIRELRRPASVLAVPNPSGRPRSNEEALFVVQFVDARWKLNSVRSTTYIYDAVQDGILSSGKITDSLGRNYVGGMARASFNMLADPPVSFEAHTVKKTVSYPPAMLDFPGFANPAADSDRAPSWKFYMENFRTRRQWTNTSAAATHLQQPYSREEIISYFAQQILAVCSNNPIALDLEYYRKQLDGNGENVFDDGDIINLDFRGMTLGESLDSFAQRLGCVWLYDKGNPSLLLSLARRSNTGSNDRVPQQSVPHLGEWLSKMEEHRVSGYINTMSTNLADTVILTHDAYYCSRLGPERSMQYGIDWFGVTGGNTPNLGHTFAHLLDSRTHTTNDGVLSTRFVTGLSADSNALWHTSASNVRNILIEVRDHIPAMVGHSTPAGFVPVWLPGTNHYAATNGSISFMPEWYFAAGGNTKGIGNTNLKIDTSLAIDNDAVDYETPWNYSSGLLRTAYRTLDTNSINDTPVEASDVFDLNSAARFDTSLKRRRELIEERLHELRFVADGDATFNRMPLGIMQNMMRQITPSVGLQYECVQFGAPDIENIRYRIWGNNTHPLLYPAGAKVEPMSAGSGAAAISRNGNRHISVRRAHTGNVLRVFMARIVGKQSIPTMSDINSQNAVPFEITKYFFVEATPDSNPFTMYWSSAGALGYKGMCSGVAFNIYEQWFNPVDDGQVRVRPVSVGGTPFNQTFGVDQDQDIILPRVPALNIVPVYEVANRLGFSSYWIAVQPDLEKRCAPNPADKAEMPTPPTWPYMGASGAATSTSGDLADIIENA